MKEYLNMWKNYVNFSDRTTPRGYWMAFLFNVIASIILAFIPFLVIPYSLAGLLPGLGLTVRRLRDSGKEWYYIFFALIPLAGPIILIIFLCKESVADDGTPIV